MNWEAIGAIGEVVGAAAVVVTLGFLIFQLRQSTFALRQQSARESTSSLQQISLAMMNPSTAGSISKIYASPDPDLTPTEMAQIEHWFLSYLLVLQQDFLDVHRGLQPSALWEARLVIINAIFIPQWSRAWWQRIGRSYVIPDFQTLIDQVLSQGPRDDGDYWKPVTANSVTPGEGTEDTA